MAFASWQSTIVDNAGNVQSDADITVQREAPGLPAAQCYSDRDGINSIGSAFQADVDGYIRFYAVGGFYRITAAKGGFSRTWQDVAIGSAQAIDISDQSISDLGLLPEYLGHLSTRIRVPVHRDDAHDAMVTRTRHIARDNIDQPRLVFPAWFVDTHVDDSGGLGTGTPGGATFTEIAVGGLSLIKASIEYPINQITPVTFSSGVVGVIPDGGNLVSDTAPIRIPRGAVFWVRSYYTSAGAGVGTGTGVPCMILKDLTFGRAEGSISGMHGTLPLTGVDGGPIVDDGISNNYYGPVAILGMTRAPSVFLVGDSIAYGVADFFTNASTLFGLIDRALGDVLPILNISIGGDRTDKFIASHARRLALAQYCSHAIVEYGTNDILGSRPLSEITADLTTMCGYFLALGKKVFMPTIVPITASTDDWATTGNQTPYGTDRIALNNSIRAGAFANVGYLELADGLETMRNSGIWRVTGQPQGYTGDGVHPSSFAAHEFAAARIFDINLFGAFATHGAIDVLLTAPWHAQPFDITVVNRLFGNELPLSTSAPADVVSITLPPGRWLILATALFNGGVTTTMIALRVSLSTTSGAFDFSPERYVAHHLGGQTALPFLPTTKITACVDLAEAMTFYLVAEATFATANCAVLGTIKAVPL